MEINTSLTGNTSWGLNASRAAWQWQPSAEQSSHDPNPPINIDHSFKKFASEKEGVRENTLTFGIMYLKIINEIMKISEGIKKSIGIRRFINEIIRIYEPLRLLFPRLKILSEILGIYDYLYTETILRPISIGVFNQLDEVWIGGVSVALTGANKTAAVNEIISDGDNSYVFDNTLLSTESDVYNLTQMPRFPGKINSVTVCAVARRFGGIPATDNNNIRLKIYSQLVFTDRDSSIKTLASDGSYTTVSETWNVSPFTGIAWTNAEINKLQAGYKLAMATGVSGGIAISQVYVVISHTTQTVVKKIINKMIAEIIVSIESSKKFVVGLITKRISETLAIVENLKSLFSTNLVYNFDDSLLPTTFYTNNWAVVNTGTPHTGSYHLKSGAISINESSAITLTALSPGISFWWKSSCDVANYGEFYVDGVIRAEISGISPYTVVQVADLSNSVHVFEWRYAKTSAAIAGDDALYVDEVHLSGTSTAQTLNSTYTFDTNPFDDFTKSGSSLWSQSSTYTYDGPYAAKTGSITASQTSTLSLVKKTTQIGFWMRGSSETSQDKLSFLIDGGTQWMGSGTGKYNREGWTFIYVYGLSNSDHTFQWRYTKNPSVNSGSDAYWIDSVQYRNSLGTLIIQEMVGIYETIIRKGGFLARVISEVVGIREATQVKFDITRRIINEKVGIKETNIHTATIINKIINEIIGIYEVIINSQAIPIFKIVAEIIGIYEATSKGVANGLTKIINETVAIKETGFTKLITNFFRRIFTFIS